MEFKKFSAGTFSYGSGEKPTLKQEDNVNFHDRHLDRVIESEYEENHE
jgi:hypothetical protein